MIDGELLKALESIADSLKRLADLYAPVEVKREKRPAVLSTATYSREEREVADFKKKAEQARRGVEASGGNG